MTRFRTTCRVAAGFYLVVVLFAVLWDSGAQIAMLKESLGPWFLDAVGKDIVLNLVMLAPLTFLAHLGWPRVAWWLRRRPPVGTQSTRPRPGPGGRTGLIRGSRPERPEGGAA